MAKQVSTSRQAYDNKEQIKTIRPKIEVSTFPEKKETPLEKALRLSDDLVLAKAIQDIIRKDSLN